jgi:hypothetical protein
MEVLSGVGALVASAFVVPLHCSRGLVCLLPPRRQCSQIPQPSRKS